MRMPLLALALATGSAFLSLCLSMRLTIALLIVGIFATGIVTESISSTAFQTFLIIGAFGFPIIFGSAILGIAAGLLIRKKRFFLAILFLIPFPFWVWHSHYEEKQSANEETLAFDFVTHNSQLRALVGGEVQVLPSTKTTYNDSSRGRYEYSFKERPLFVIVDVTRTGDETHFNLACVTTLPSGQRDALKDACQQAIVELSPLR